MKHRPIPENYLDFHILETTESSGLHFKISTKRGYTAAKQTYHFVYTHYVRMADMWRKKWTSFDRRILLRR